MKEPLMRKSQYSVAGESYRDVQSTAVRSIPAWCFPRVSDVTDSALITILLHVELDVSVLVKLAIVSWNRYVTFPRTIYLRGIFPFVVFGLLLVVVGLSMNEYSGLLCHSYTGERPWMRQCLSLFDALMTLHFILPSYGCTHLSN